LSLKKELAVLLRRKLKAARKQIKDTEKYIDHLIEATTNLKKFDMNRARYKVGLMSMWSDHGEEDVTFLYTGNLADAIVKAEAEFMRINQRSNVSANYSVAVFLSGVWVIVPPAYWQELTHTKDWKPEDHLSSKEG
jgi:hypothetical protein